MMPAYDPTFGSGGTLFITGSGRESCGLSTRQAELTAGLKVM